MVAESFNEKRKVFIPGMLPTLLLFTLGQKYILSGALAGAVKG